MVGSHECLGRRVDADDPAEDPHADDRHLPGHFEPSHVVALELHVEVARPHERQHGAGETADQSHEQGEVGDGDGQQHGDDDQENPECHRPYPQLAILRETGRELGFGLSLEQRRLQKIGRREIWQRVGEKSFHDEDQVDDDLEPFGGEVVGDDLLGFFAEGEKGHPCEPGLEGRGRDVAPVQHAVELAAVLHVPLQTRQEDLRGVANEMQKKGHFITSKLSNNVIFTSICYTLKNCNTNNELQGLSIIITDF